ncbi:hypothetical protein [Saccharopolyspora hordei]|uniref:Uncharacterized protein n=1 Tax=Saccharopolyspora hordei TaxID=1838 RepID=A0A853AUV4_9PSEU|nr:hypothetical protein [Saccharopolyspora hordei]NYI86412.1 hypothetical protein [Saccharopolyspora hordei]
MAKNSFPMMQSSSGVLSKVVKVVLGLALVLLVVNYPSDAATWVKDALSWLGTAAHGVASFLREVFSR